MKGQDKWNHKVMEAKLSNKSRQRMMNGEKKEEEEEGGRGVLSTQHTTSFSPNLPG